LTFTNASKENKTELFSVQRTHNRLLTFKHAHFPSMQNRTKKRLKT